MSWRHGLAATIAAVATLVGFSGAIVDDRMAVTFLGLGVLVALGLGGRARPVRGDR